MPAASKKSIVTGLAGWSIRHPGIAILAWTVLVLVSMIGGNLAGMHKATDTQLTPGEAGRAAAMITAAGLDAQGSESVVITAKNGAALDRAVVGNTGPALARALGQLPMVASVAPGLLSSDGSTMLLPLTLSNRADDPKPLLDRISELGSTYPELQIAVTGSLTIGSDVDAQLARDFGSALLLSLPITLLILLLAFGALLAAGVPVLLGASSVLAAVGLYTVTSHVLPDGGSGAELILLIGMAVGVDYSLFYLKREREERLRGRTGEQALLVAAATAGHAVVTSGCALMVAMAGLFLLGDVNFASMAVGAVLVVALAVLGSLTVLPAVLGLLGARVDRPRIPILSRLTMSGRPGRVWPKLLRPALKFPAITLLIAVGGMLVLAWPATHLHLKSGTEADLPQTLPSVAAHERLTSAFPDERSQLEVVLHGGRAEVDSVVRRLESSIEAPVSGPSSTGGPAPTGGPASTGGQASPAARPVRLTTGQTSVLSIPVPFTADSPEARAILAELRGSTIPAALQGVSVVQVAVGGSIARNADYVDELTSGAPWVVGFVLLMTFLLMTVVFRSVVVGLVAIACNLLSAGAAFGVLALVFQSSWGAELLGFHLSGGVIAWIPVFLFVILFGLSMDYHVLVISRIKEASDRGLPTRQAVSEGIGRSAPVISSAAAVMIGVFAIFAGLHMVEFKELGVGLGAAVLLDAVVVRIMILPALMALLGRANWWAPSFLRSDRRPPAALPVNRPD